MVNGSKWLLLVVHPLPQLGVTNTPPVFELLSGPRHAGGAESHLGIQRGSASAPIGATAEGIARLTGAPEEGASKWKVGRNDSSEEMVKW